MGANFGENLRKYAQSTSCSELIFFTCRGHETLTIEKKIENLCIIKNIV